MEHIGIEDTATRGGKAQALKNVLDNMPPNVFANVVLPAASMLGWEKCPWSDDSISKTSSREARRA